MVPDAESTSHADGAANVVAAVDEGAEERFVIADISRDDAWVSATNAGVPSLDEWC